ncbi:uncharacterized protein TEOVI_000048700 [Trypanosoma equiperdum]|uniref:Uncharacterized protein n=1 Tax=Trypanosoma equiperdum TaxID=5694 RepID=A0A1G4I801_TRYEQ|nr:hypothetical protein TEOVI_000048700 [Trypanosoma equiperdum]
MPDPWSPLQSVDKKLPSMAAFAPLVKRLATAVNLPSMAAAESVVCPWVSHSLRTFCSMVPSGAAVPLGFQSVPGAAVGLHAFPVFPVFVLSSAHTQKRASMAFAAFPLAVSEPQFACLVLPAWPPNAV